MSSLFSIGAVRRQSPAWCKKGMYPKTLSSIDGYPSGLQAYAQWHEISSGRQVIRLETFRLTRIPGQPEWLGVSADVDYNLHLYLAQTAPPATYSITLSLRLGQEIVDSIEWSPVAIPQPEPWDTGTLLKTITPRTDYRKLRILS